MFVNLNLVETFHRTETSLTFSIVNNMRLFKESNYTIIYANIYIFIRKSISTSYSHLSPILNYNLFSEI